MDSIKEFISNQALDSVLRFLLPAGMSVLIFQLRLILRRIRLSEFKHVATIHALNKSLGNGFMDYYKGKLESLIEEFNFKTGK